MTKRYIDVAVVSELQPGSMKCVDVAGARLLLANIDGRYCAVADTCTHEDASLSTGVLKGSLVRCPLHGSRFDVCTGEVQEDPAEQDLRTYPVRVEGERIQVEISPDGAMSVKATH